MVSQITVGLAGMGTVPPQPHWCIAASACFMGCVANSAVVASQVLATQRCNPHAGSRVLNSVGLSARAQLRSKAMGQDKEKLVALIFQGIIIFPCELQAPRKK